MRSVLCFIAVTLLAGMSTSPDALADTNEGGTNRQSQGLITAGTGHTCAVVGGAAKCWGANSWGQLGVGNYANYSTPQDVTGLAAGISSVTAGDGHTCALTTSGAVKCWGRGTSGQLGNNATTTKTTAVDVSGLGSGVSAVSAGGYHVCALTTSGAVKCWGLGTAGQLGNGASITQKVPVDVSGLGSGVTAIATGLYHSCALTSAGGVKCWGGADGGRTLGNGATTNQNSPVDVTGLTSGVTAISAGEYHTCALVSDGSVKCWGRGGYGQMGNAVWDNQPSPVSVAALPGPVAAVAAGGYHSCAVTVAGASLCWGLGTSGQLGQSAFSSDNIPVDVSGLQSGVTAVTGGQKHTCAISNNSVVCWGLNTWGQLGSGNTTDNPKMGNGVIAFPDVPMTPSTVAASVTTTSNPSVTVTTAKKATTPVTTIARSPSPGATTSTVARNPGSGGATTTTRAPSAGVGATSTTSAGGTEPSPESPTDSSTPPTSVTDGAPPSGDKWYLDLPELSPRTGPVDPGVTIDIDIPGLEPGEEVECRWVDSDGRAIEGQSSFVCGTAGDDGRLRAGVQVPPGAEGEITLVAVGRVSKHGVRQVVLVGSHPSNSRWWLIALALATILIFIFLLLRRRRDNEDEEDLPGPVD